MNVGLVQTQISDQRFALKILYICFIQHISGYATLRALLNSLRLFSLRRLPRSISVNRRISSVSDRLYCLDNGLIPSLPACSFLFSRRRTIHPTAFSGRTQPLNPAVFQIAFYVGLIHQIFNDLNIYPMKGGADHLFLRLLVHQAKPYSCDGLPRTR